MFCSIFCQEASTNNWMRNARALVTVNESLAAELGRRLKPARTVVVLTATVDRTARVGPKDDLVLTAIGLRKVVHVRTVKGDRKLVVPNVPAIVRHVQRPEKARSHAATRNRAAKVISHAASGSREITTRKPRRRSPAEPQL